MQLHLRQLPVLLLLLLLLQCTCLLAYRSPWQRCNEEMPKCKSDRFDIVFKNYDQRGCKKYECECKKPEMAVCSSGKAKLKTDSNNCQYYDCVQCPPRQPCAGSKVSKYKADDANGCPLYSCQCDPHPRKPACSADEQLSNGIDSSGCRYFFCQQVRAKCPEKPKCTENQELVVSGVVNQCRVYKCECLTPVPQPCSIGSQPRLQDDGIGCPSYRCVENRTPCPREPDCPSRYQIVARVGVDENNCFRYECQCMPMANLQCPEGFRRELETDSSTNCEFFKCVPACDRAPNCTSIYEKPVVVAKLANGCPRYACSCKKPQVINCVAEDAHLMLTKAPDGSNCDVYSCHTDNERACPAPSCQNPVPTLATDNTGCLVFRCINCPPPPTCLNSGEQLLRAGEFNDGCVRYICYRPICPLPRQCTGNEVAAVIRYAGTCPVYACLDRTVCADVPKCASDNVAKRIGTLINGCPEYICQPTACQSPSNCSLGQQANLLIDSNACVTVQCSGNERNNGGGNGDRGGDNRDGGCPPRPDCGSDKVPVAFDADEEGCALYKCKRKKMDEVVTTPEPRNQNPSCNSDAAAALHERNHCKVNEEVVVSGYDSNNCPLFACKRVCQPAPSCSSGEEAKVVKVTNGCAEFRCEPTVRSCPARPDCPVGKEVQTAAEPDSAGCAQFVCCSKEPKCLSGFSLTVTGVDSIGCKLYSCGHSGNQDRNNDACPTPPSCSSGKELIRRPKQADQRCDQFLCCPVVPECSNGQLVTNGFDSNGCRRYRCKRSSRCPTPSLCPDGKRPGVINADDNGCAIYAACASITSTTEATTTPEIITTVAPTPQERRSSCPAQSNCEYHKFPVRYNEQHGGEKCEMFSCIRLGDYNGNPQKCSNNPKFCEITDTVETFVDSKRGCQRIQCKGSNSAAEYMSLFGF